MKLLYEQVVGAVVIAGLVAMGLFMAEEPELPNWLSGQIPTQSISNQLSSVTVSNVDWSADGKMLLCQSRGGLNAVPSMIVHDVKTSVAYAPSWAGVISSEIIHSSLTPDGTSVVVATYGGELWRIDLETSSGTELARLPTKHCFFVTAVGHDSQLMAGGADDGRVYLCDSTHRESKVLSADSHSSVRRLRFSNDSQRLLCIRGDKSISVWETASGKLIDEFPTCEADFAAAVFLPDGHHILASSENDSVQILDIASGDRVWQGARGTVGKYGILAMDVATTGNLAAWSDALNCRIVVWDLENHQKRFEINNPSVVTHLKFSPDGTTLAVAGRESVVRVYDLRDGLELHKIDVGRFVEPM